MADINSLSFGCGNTLLASQLNIMVDAIRSLITLVGTIGDKVGSYIPLSGSEDISGVLAPDTNEGHNLGKSDKRWGTVWASTGGFKVIDFYDLQSPYGKLGELYVGKDTSNNNEIILHFKHGNDNEEIVATRDWVNSLLNPTRINIGSTGSISEELYNDKSNYIKIESSSDNPIVIAGYDENTLPSGIKFGDASTGDVLTVYNGKIYVNGDIFSGDNGVSVLNDLSDVKASAPTTGEFLMYNGRNWVSNPLPESLIIHPSDVSRNEEYYLMYEETNEYPSGRYSWVERPSGANELNELDDVEIDDTKLELGQVLVYSRVTDGDNNTYNSWVNKTLSGSLTYDQSDSNKYLKVNSNGNGTEWSDISLSDLSNTEIGGSNNALLNGLVLVYDSSSNNWKNTSLPANLPNTSTDNNGQYLTVENGIAKWVSVTPGGVSSLNDLSDVSIGTGDDAPTNGQLLVHNGTNWVNKKTLNELTIGNTTLNGTYIEIMESDKLHRTIIGTDSDKNITFLTMSRSSTSPGSSGSTWIPDTGQNAKVIKINGVTVGLTGIGYKNSNDSTATSVATSGLSLTLKAGTNVSFTNSGTELTINASGTNSGGGGNGTVTKITVGDGLVDGSGSSSVDITSSGTIKLPTFNNNDGNSNTSGKSVGPTSNTLGTGNTLKVPKITYDKYGRITNAAEYTITLPSGGLSWADLANNDLNYLTSELINPNHIPIATSSTLGGIKTNYTRTVGSNNYAVSIDLNSGGAHVTINKASNNDFGVIKLGYDETNSGTTKNYAVKLDSNDKAYVNVPWTASNSGSSNRTLENATTRNNLKSALLLDKSICVMFDNVDSDSNVTSLDYVRISELRYKAKKSLQSSFFFYRGTIDATNNIINPVFYVDLNYKIFLTKVTNTTNDFARINAFNSNNIPIDTYSTWTSAAETVVKNLLLNKYGISCDFNSTSATSGAYSIGTTNRLVQKTVNFYIEED